MKLSDFMLRMERELSDDPSSHTLHPGLKDVELEAWYTNHPGERLPEDLLTLLRWSNGFGYYQEYFNGEAIHLDGAFRFLPLKEIKRADLVMYNEEQNDHPYLPPTRRAFLQGPDSTVFFGYDSESLHFWRFEPIIPEENDDLGPDMGLLLEHLF